MKRPIENYTFFKQIQLCKITLLLAGTQFCNKNVCRTEVHE